MLPMQSLGLLAFTCDQLAIIGFQPGDSIISFQPSVIIISY